MPPKDDPLARLHGRAVFSDVIVGKPAGSTRTHEETQWPVLGGTEVDLYMLYEGVRGLGGFQAVQESRSWSRMRKFMHIPAHVNSFGTQLMQKYERMLAWSPDPNVLQTLHLRCDAAYKRISMNDPTSAFVKARGCHPKNPATLRGDVEDANNIQNLSAAERAQLPESVLAAYKARLNPYALSDEERAHPLFAEFASTLTLLDLRMLIVCRWYRRVTRPLHVFDALRDVPGRYVKMGVAVYTYLDVTGAINFGPITMHAVEGVIPRLRYSVPRTLDIRIAVIGAGLAGLAAARHLRRFGLNVTLLEAHPRRVGGRVCSDESGFSTPVDLGALVIDKLPQNPLAVVAEQCSVKLCHVNMSDFPLFSEEGELVSVDGVWKASKDFHETMKIACSIRRNPQYAEERLRRCSLGEVFQKAFEQREERRVALNLRSTQRRAGRPLSRFASGHVPVAPLGREVVARENAERTFTGQFIRWNFARLEAKHGADAYTLSFTEWDNTDGSTPSDKCALLEGGFHSIAEDMLETQIFSTLAEPISFDRRVNRITYLGSQNGKTPESLSPKLEIQYSSESGAPGQVERNFDYAIVAVPLGVLKSKYITFDPPLPEALEHSLSRLRVGRVVHVILEFPNAFWGNRPGFGVMREELHLRGEFFQFWSLLQSTGKPILVAIVAEPSAHRVEEKSEEVVVKDAMSLIRNVYPTAQDPVHAKVTNWFNDSFTAGTHSYIPPGATKADRHAAASDLVHGTIAFAGEYNFSAGASDASAAFLSGYRAAHDIIRAAGLLPSLVYAQETMFHDLAGHK